MIPGLSPTPEELRSTIAANGVALDKSSMVKTVTLAKDIAGEDELYSLAPRARLGYVQRRVKELGLVDFKEVDSHTAANVLQLVYGIDMGADSEMATNHLYSPFITASAEKAGLIRTEGENVVSTMTEEQAHDIAEKFSPRMNDQIAEIASLISAGSGNDLFERLCFNRRSAEEITDKDSLKIVGIVREAYLKRYGELLKIGEYKCPVDPAMVQFCHRMIQEELGIPLETKVLLDTRGKSPYIAGKDLVIPAALLSIPEVRGHLEPTLVELMTNIVLKHSNLYPGEFSSKRPKEERVDAFKKFAWTLGTGQRLAETARRKVLEKRGLPAENVEERWIERCSEVTAHNFLVPETVAHFGLDDVVRDYIHIHLSAPYGWHFVDAVRREDFKSLVKEETPWRNKILGWNNKLNKVSRSFLGRCAKATEDGTLIYMLAPGGNELFTATLTALEGWKKDFLRS